MCSIRPRRSWLFSFALLLTAFALITVACGSDDDDGEGGSSDDGGSSDGGDSGNGGDNGGSSGGGDDDSYVNGLCGAVNSFLADAEEAIGDFDLDDPDSVGDVLNALEDIGAVTASFVDDLDNLNPPGDFASFHDIVRDNFNDLAEALGDPSITDIASLGSVFDIPLPSADIQARFASAAQNSAECREMDLFGATS